MPNNLRVYQGLDDWIGEDFGDEGCGLPCHNDTAKIKDDVQDDFSQFKTTSPNSI